jgi:hypothetical protein
MGRTPMDSFTRRGAVAALFTVGTLGLGTSLDAQSAGVIQLRQREPRDSAEVRATMVMSKARLDSLATLMREFNKIPPGTPEWEATRAQIDALMPARPNQILFRMKSGASLGFPKGWIGINALGPKSEFIGPDSYVVQYFDYQSIISVDPDSPAQRAGIVPGDTLTGYEGVDLRGRRFDLTQMLVPDKKLSVSVKHDGETKDYVLTVAPAPRPVFERRMDVSQTEAHAVRAAQAGADAPRIGGMARAGGSGGSALAGVFSRMYFITPNGAFGAVLSTVGPELAKTLKLEPGVLVNDVTDETPASRGGLRTGDVITSVAGQSVASLKALQQAVAMRGGERSVVLEVVRDKRPQKVTVSW